MKRNFIHLITVCLLLIFALVTFQNSALAADGLLPRQSIRVGEALKSSDGRYTLTLQRDGNLVLYRVSPREPLWDSETDGDVAMRATLQSDGNFVVYAPDNRPLWDSETDGERIARAVLQNDGNFVLYRSDRSAAWATGTNEPPPPPPGLETSFCCSIYRDGKLTNFSSVTARSKGAAKDICARRYPPPFTISVGDEGSSC
jgi:hypothetical protein